MDGEASSSPRRRRLLIALLLLVLVLLPLYLWPLRADLGWLPGRALSGPFPDPRSAAALARIPGEVWDALMGRVAAPPPTTSVPAARNLTMIAEIAEFLPGLLSQDPGALPLSGESVALAQLGASQDELRSTLGTGDGPEGPGTDAAWTGGYSTFGPWTSGGPGGGSRVFPSASTLAPGDPGAPAPTPEPATLILVGSNLALLGATAWRRSRRRRALAPHR